ncbi:hypothetical protein L1987_32760 [Smallanthus sonchifolius]|uniref:Uncharacterized protein n=1 Tax=Smallanthus sonchifolius TaxID=185202 RepID=A0ACB9HQ01_9ASTR|nr:hypothetical protein L1987_32760 [Smallanthus sonchifolius]
MQSFMQIYGQRARVPGAIIIDERTTAVVKEKLDQTAAYCDQTQQMQDGFSKKQHVADLEFSTSKKAAGNPVMFNWFSNVKASKKQGETGRFDSTERSKVSKRESSKF